VVSLAARWGVEFALSAPGDAQLLLAYSRKALLDMEPRGALADGARNEFAALPARQRLVRKLVGRGAVETG
jgi:hypothetical protein